MKINCSRPCGMMNHPSAMQSAIYRASVSLLQQTLRCQRGNSFPREGRPCGMMNHPSAMQSAINRASVSLLQQTLRCQRGNSFPREGRQR